MTDPPNHLKAGRLDRWFMSLELLSRFPGWRDLAQHMIQWLWNNRVDEGLWDFGPRAAFSIVLPLSESWRRKWARQFDWTTRVLLLLHHYHADSG